ncbi:UNVERIFIED_CONTAM: hypothetical protein RMT77_000062 [Armadillidium vulgare]
MRKKHFFIFIFLCTLIIFIKKLYLYESIDSDFLLLEKCPSCYGNECELITNETFALTSYTYFKIFNKFFNVKNVYYGHQDGKLYVIKKLAHNVELDSYDKKLCEAVHLPYNCDSGYAVRRLIDSHHNNLDSIIEKNPALFGDSEPLKCKHDRVLTFLFHKFQMSRTNDQIMHNFLTLMAVNPEPVIMQAFENVFPFPKYYGACGRVVVQELAGSPLSRFYGNPWLERASLAVQLLQIANSMTEHYIRIYLTDPSSDNFAVDSKGNVKLVDLENIVLVDSQKGNLEKSVHFNEGNGCSGCFSYDYEDLCNFFKADHNYFAICKGLLSSSPFTSSLPGGLLHSIPENILKKYPNLLKLIEECAQPESYSNRLEPAKILLKTLNTLIS